MSKEDSHLVRVNNQMSKYISHMELNTDRSGLLQLQLRHMNTIWNKRIILIYLTYVWFKWHHIFSQFSMYGIIILVQLNVYLYPLFKIHKFRFNDLLPLTTTHYTIFSTSISHHQYANHWNLREREQVLQDKLCGSWLIILCGFHLFIVQN
jgi:hypothetical protein